MTSHSEDLGPPWAPAGLAVHWQGMVLDKKKRMVLEEKGKRMLQLIVRENGVEYKGTRSFAVGRNGGATRH